LSEHECSWFKSKVEVRADLDGAAEPSHFKLSLTIPSTSIRIRYLFLVDSRRPPGCSATLVHSFRRASVCCSCAQSSPCHSRQVSAPTLPLQGSHSVFRGSPTLPCRKQTPPCSHNCKPPKIALHIFTMAKTVYVINIPNKGSSIGASVRNKSIHRLKSSSRPAQTPLASFLQRWLFR